MSAASAMRGFHAALAARLAGVPQVLVSIHGSHRDLQQPGNRLRRAVVAHGLEPATLSLATAIVTVCDYTARRDFLQRHRAKLLPPVPNGVPLPAPGRPHRAAVRAELGIGDERIAAACVSRLTLEKGYGDLAAALARLDAPDVPLDLVVVGGGDDDGSIRALVRRPAAHRRALRRPSARCEPIPGSGGPVRLPDLVGEPFQCAA